MKRTNREARDFDVLKALDKDDSYIVEGYITTWEPYVMESIGGQDYYEQISPEAFNNTDFSDTCFRVDHEGTVYARTRNQTIVSMTPDEHGLKCVIDLSKTAAAREKYEEIKSGMYDKMSQLMHVSKDHYDRETRTRVIDEIDKLYDISIVAFPANDGTSVEARSTFWDGVISEVKQAERLENEKEKLKLKLKLMEI